jgi:hypothetical protein
MKHTRKENKKKSTRRKKNLVKKHTRKYKRPHKVKLQRGGNPIEKALARIDQVKTRIISIKRILDLPTIKMALEREISTLKAQILNMIKKNLIVPPDAKKVLKEKEDELKVINEQLKKIEGQNITINDIDLIKKHVEDNILKNNILIIGPYLFTEVSQSPDTIAEKTLKIFNTLGTSEIEMHVFYDTANKLELALREIFGDDYGRLLEELKIVYDSAIAPLLSEAKQAISHDEKETGEEIQKELAARLAANPEGRAEEDPIINHIKEAAAATGYTKPKYLHQLSGNFDDGDFDDGDFEERRGTQPSKGSSKLEARPKKGTPKQGGVTPTNHNWNQVLWKKHNDDENARRQKLLGELQKGSEPVRLEPAKPPSAPLEPTEPPSTQFPSQLADGSPPENISAPNVIIPNPLYYEEDMDTNFYPSEIDPNLYMLLFPNNSMIFTVLDLTNMNLLRLFFEKGSFFAEEIIKELEYSRGRILELLDIKYGNMRKGKATFTDCMNSFKENAFFEHTDPVGGCVKEFYDYFVFELVCTYYKFYEYDIRPSILINLILRIILCVFPIARTTEYMNNLKYFKTLIWNMIVYVEGLLRDGQITSNKLRNDSSLEFIYEDGTKYNPYRQ